MYLSRLLLDPRSPSVRRDAGNLHAMHRTVMSAFPGLPGEAARAAHGVLWRLEPDERRGRLELLVQSTTIPDWSSVPPGYLREPSPETKSVDTALASLTSGMRLRFRLVANPTRKIDTKSGPDGDRRNGQRVPLRGEEEQLSWLIRKGQAAGFSVGANPGEAVRSVVARPLGDLVGWRKHAGDEAARITLRGTGFEGVLSVTDGELLRQAVCTGIGPGKAYGFGLLSVAPVGP